MQKVGRFLDVPPRQERWFVDVIVVAACFIDSDVGEGKRAHTQREVNECRV